jgi:hypothetical protein
MIGGPHGQPWFLRKQEQGSIFGPLTFEQLVRWASSAQIAPTDSVSTDETNWIKAPMLPELRMDWIVETGDERYYGPTTLSAILEVLRLQEINQETFVINACDGTRQQIKDMTALLQAETVDSEAAELYLEAASAYVADATTGTATEIDDRIRTLEQALANERKAVAEAEARYRHLEDKYRELLDSCSSL